MATITPVASTSTGATVSYVSAAVGGDSVTVGSNNVALRVRNGSGGSINVTLTGAQRCNQGSLHDLVVAVAAGAEKAILIPDRCVDDNGACAVTYSAVTTVTVAATR
jgi:hypothetical protein